MAPQAENANLDKLLQEIGEFGKFQKIHLALICLPVVLAAFPAFSYVFAAGSPDYRCLIPECETNTTTSYTPDWISHAVPTKNGKPDFCFRYEPFNNYTRIDQAQCDPSLFTNKPVKCNELVFTDNHTTIVNSFKLFCDDNQWQLTLIGTLNGVGQFICLPIIGVLSDRHGRKSVLLASIFLSSIMGTIRSFTTSIQQYMVFELLDTIVGAGAYSTAFVLGMELVGPSYRVRSCALLSICFALGEILVGIIAWQTYSWRIFLLALYLPGFIIILYWWLIPESLRWMIAHQKTEQAMKILKDVARLNQTKLPEAALENLLQRKPESSQPTGFSSFIAALKNKVLFWRFLNCSLAWITTNLTYYGLSLNVVAISGNKYINFISVAAAEIPAYILCTFLFDRFGRRKCLSLAYIIVGVACLSFIIIPKGGVLQTFVFILGKCASTISFTAIYIFTSELFPTTIRHSAIAYCSMLGRVGGMVAPQTPLLALVWGPLPLMIFGVLGVLAGITSIFFPETLNTRLPDTIEEAVNISKQRRESFQLEQADRT